MNSAGSNIAGVAHHQYGFADTSTQQKAGTQSRSLSGKPTWFTEICCTLCLAVSYMSKTDEHPRLLCLGQLAESACEPNVQTRLRPDHGVRPADGPSYLPILRVHVRLSFRYVDGGRLMAIQRGRALGLVDRAIKRLWLLT